MVGEGGELDYLRLLAGTGLLGKENGLDVGQDTTLSNSDMRQKAVQLFVVADGKLQVARVDSRLLVVTSGVTGQLEDLSSQILHDGSKVDWGASSYTLGEVSIAEKTVDATHWKLKSSTG